RLRMPVRLFLGTSGSQRPALVITPRSLHDHPWLKRLCVFNLLCICILRGVHVGPYPQLGFFG
ncbi:MAG: hypothetical protein ACXVA4_14110, partial [Ktedonobacterales bacterium]